MPNKWIWIGGILGCLGGGLFGFFSIESSQVFPPFEFLIIIGGVLGALTGSLFDKKRK